MERILQTEETTCGLGVGKPISRLEERLDVESSKPDRNTQQNNKTNESYLEPVWDHCRFTFAIHDFLYPTPRDLPFGGEPYHDL